MRETTIARNYAEALLLVAERHDAAEQYAEVLQLAQNRERWLCSIRIPGRTEYLAALDDAVHAVLAGESSAEDALQQAADRWNQITAARGLERQQEAYLKSIGLEP